jgi:type I restriction enzyme S subunit
MDVIPGYKQTQVGVIPEDWGTSSLLSVAECLDSVRVPLNESQRQRMQGDIPYCGANGVLDYVDDFVIDDDIILIAEDGGYFDEYASRPIAYRMKGKCWVNNHAHILKTRPEHDQGFLFYSLVHKNILPFLARGTRAKLNKSEMEKIIVPAPSTNTEQRAIATALSDVDVLMGGLDRLIAKKRDLKQAVMQQLLTGESRLPGFHGEWEVKPLGEVISKCFGGATPRRNRPEFYRGNVRWITSGELNYNVIVDTIEKISNEAVAETNLAIVPAGTFLMAITGLEAEGTRGACAIVGAPSTTNQSCMAVFPTAALVSKYLFHYYVFRGKALALQYCQGTKQQSYTAGLVKQLPIALPPSKEEQHAIAGVLSDMDAELAALEARRDKTRDLKQAMMQELLTGKTRLVPVGAAHA